MATKVFTFFLSLILLWSSLSTVETPPTFAVSPEQALVSLAGSTTPPDQGSVEDHHLDDLPSPAQEDSPNGMLALLPTSLAFVLARLPAAKPVVAPLTAIRTPFLAGPLRPPSRVSQAA